MNIAVLSGKGGTGKTTISTNLALTIGANYIDCDVEEPNGYIFLNPSNIIQNKVFVAQPFIDDEKCDRCGKCSKQCKFNALVQTKKDILLFKKLCHSCKVCELVCENNAITYTKRSIGVIEEGIFNGNTFKRGILNVGEPMAIPVIKELLKNTPDGINIIDCSPGTSCNVVTSLKFVDAALLVTEPTIFGLHDLKMAVLLLRMFNMPFGIIINKSNSNENMIINYCLEENIPVLGSIPYDKEAAENYSKGKMLIELEKFKEVFWGITNRVKEELLWKL